VTAYRIASPSQAADALRRLRLAAGVSQDAVARRLDNTRQIVNYRERGTRKLTADALFGTAAAIGCDVVIAVRPGTRHGTTGTGWPA
jgi:transcriptional regulator with XRE-family HTH domain